MARFLTAFLIEFFLYNQCNCHGIVDSSCLIVLALCNWPNPFRHPVTKSHQFCRHYWHHHWPALDSTQPHCHYDLPDNGSNVRRELAIFSRYGGGFCWLLHDSWFGAGRGLWHQCLQCYRGGGKRPDYTHKAYTSWWFDSLTQSVGRGWVHSRSTDTSKATVNFKKV